MAGSVNKVILVGNFCADPEVRTMQSGDRVANFTIATSESWKDKATGERKQKSEFHRVVIFNQGLISVVENYTRKGSKVYLEGQLETRKWTDQQGVEKYSTEVVLRPFRGELTLLDSKSEPNNNYQSAQASQPEEFEDSIPFSQHQRDILA